MDHGRLLLLLASFFSQTAADSKCDSCKLLVKSFRNGMRKTEKGNFGGGNTAWEEASIGKFSTSETRLVEILEYVCRKSDDKKEEIEDEWFPTLKTDKSADHMCHAIVEEHEEAIENWYFHKQKQYPNFYNWLCVDQLKKCCRNGTYGKNCDECTSTSRGVCNARGECNGDGTRHGTGKCKCKPGYTGEKCDQCANSYFIKDDTDDAFNCAACHASCDVGCTGDGSEHCDDCRRGYEWSTKDSGIKFCQDVNECERTPDICAEQENTYCLNFPGKYSCECKQGYKKVDGKCTLDIIEPEPADQGDEEEEEEDDWDSENVIQRDQNKLAEEQLREDL